MDGMPMGRRYPEIPQGADFASSPLIQDPLIMSDEGTIVSFCFWWYWEVELIGED
jgi:hypothetical protein